MNSSTVMTVACAGRIFYVSIPGKPGGQGAFDEEIVYVSSVYDHGNGGPAWTR